VNHTSHVEKPEENPVRVVPPTPLHRRAIVTVGVYRCAWCRELHEGRALLDMCHEALAPSAPPIIEPPSDSLFGGPFTIGSA